MKFRFKDSILDELNTDTLKSPYCCMRPNFFEDILNEEEEKIYLKETGWTTDPNGNTNDFSIGTWNPHLRIACVNNGITLNKSIIVQINNVEIDGGNATINTPQSYGIIVSGKHDLQISNFKFSDCLYGIVLFIYNTRILIQKNTFTDVDIGIYLGNNNSSNIIKYNLYSSKKNNCVGIFLKTSAISNIISNNKIEICKSNVNINDNSNVIYGIYIGYLSAFNLIKNNIIILSNNNYSFTSYTNNEVIGILLADDYISSNKIIKNAIYIENNVCLYLPRTELADTIIQNKLSGILADGNSISNNEFFSNQIFIKGNKSINNMDVTSRLLTLFSGIFFNTILKEEILTNAGNSANTISRNTINLLENHYETNSENNLSVFDNIYTGINNWFGHGNAINSNSICVFNNSIKYSLALESYSLNNFIGIDLTMNHGTQCIENNVKMKRNKINSQYTQNYSTISFVSINIMASYGCSIRKNNCLLLENNITFQPQSKILALLGSNVASIRSYIIILLSGMSNIIESNRLCNSDSDGISLGESNNCYKISKNIIVNNTGVGIFIPPLPPILPTNNNNNTLINNLIMKNHTAGISISKDNHFNSIINNNFIDNTVNAYDENNPSDNYFDNNYWSDYSGTPPYYIPIANQDFNPSPCIFPLA